MSDRRRKKFWNTSEMMVCFVASVLGLIKSNTGKGLDEYK
jgi:hypothetical protein